MAHIDGETTLAEENEKLRQSLIGLAADMYVNSCGSDLRSKRRAIYLAEGVGTEQELQAAIEVRRPQIKQLREVATQLGVRLD